MLWLVPVSYGLYILSLRRVGKKRWEKTTEKYSLFLYSQVVWDDVWQRPQELAMGMTKYRPVIYFSPVQIHWRIDMDRTGEKTEQVQRISGKGIRHIDKDHGLTVAIPLLFPGEYKSCVVRFFNRIVIKAEARWLVKKALFTFSGDPGSQSTKASGLRGMLFLTNSPFVDDLAKEKYWKLQVFDVIDEYTAFTWAPQGSAKREERLLRSANLVFTGTRELFERKRSLNPNMHFIPCGVDYELFVSGGKHLPCDIADIPKPIVGYIGTLSDRIDTNLIREMSASLPEVSFIFVGPLRGAMGSIPRAENIHYLGLKAHDRLPDYLAHFDVAIMPFRQDDATLAINPVKTLEYLAAGKPVVSTHIPDVVRYFNEYVDIAKDRSGFIKMVKTWTERDTTDFAEKAREFASGKKWKTMVDDMEKLLESVEADMTKSSSTPESMIRR